MICPIKSLVGGLEHEFYDCSIYWEFHHPNCLIFFRGVGLKPPPRLIRGENLRLTLLTLLIYQRGMYISGWWF